jgi:hypothetical protein
VIGTALGLQLGQLIADGTAYEKHQCCVRCNSMQSPVASRQLRRCCVQYNAVDDAPACLVLLIKCSGSPSLIRNQRSSMRCWKAGARQRSQVYLSGQVGARSPKRPPGPLFRYRYGSSQTDWYGFATAGSMIP